MRQIVLRALLACACSSIVACGPQHIRAFKQRERNYHEGDYAAARGESAPSSGSLYSEAVAGSEFEFQFFLSKDKTVNAYATPGGYIYVTEGLMDVMAYDQSMVAAVMAHEMGHVLERHVKDGYEKGMQGAAGLTVLGVLLGKKNRDALNLRVVTPSDQRMNEPPHW